MINGQKQLFRQFMLFEFRANQFLPASCKILNELIYQISLRNF